MQLLQQSSSVLLVSQICFIPALEHYQTADHVAECFRIRIDQIDTLPNLIIPYYKYDLNQVKVMRKCC